MLKIDRQKQQFSRLDTPSLADVSLSERYHLQAYICNSPEAFFQEIGEDLFLIEQEVQPSDDVQDRIDLLALDKEGQAVVIELKRGNDKLQMFQAISYAAMIAKWQPEKLLELLKRRGPNRIDQLDNFLEIVDKDEINRHQRIILVAEDFDYSVLIGAEWLSEQYGVDIICCRLSVAKDAATDAEFLVCSNIFPAPEIAQQAIRRGRKRPGASTPKWSGWDTALADVTNSAVITYFKMEIEAGREDYLQRRKLHYRDKENKRRWSVQVRAGFAFAAQDARFEGDDFYWRNALSEPEYLKPVADGQCLSFRLYTVQDFQFFHQAVTNQLVGTKWTSTYKGRAEPGGEGDGQSEEIQ